MERRNILRILETANELIVIAKSIARGSEPTVRCQPSRPHENAGTHLTLSFLFNKEMIA